MAYHHSHPPNPPQLPFNVHSAGNTRTSDDRDSSLFDIYQVKPITDIPIGWPLPGQPYPFPFPYSYGPYPPMAPAHLPPANLVNGPTHDGYAAAPHPKPLSQNTKIPDEFDHRKPDPSLKTHEDGKLNVSAPSHSFAKRAFLQNLGIVLNILKEMSNVKFLWC